MFTLKLVRHSDEYATEMYQTPTFHKERIVTETGHVVIVISGVFDGMSDDIHISSMEEDWQECFVMNDQGVTVEKIRAEVKQMPPKESVPSVTSELGRHRLEWIYIKDENIIPGGDWIPGSHVENVGYEFDGDIWTDGQDRAKVCCQRFLPKDDDAKPVRLEEILRDACKAAEGVEFVLLRQVR